MAEKDSSSQIDTPQDRRSGRPSWRGRLPVALWLVVAVGMVLWLAIGSVSTTSYTYNQFIEVTYRNVSQTALMDIWTHQAEQLPSIPAQALLDVGFVLSCVMMVVGVLGGSWLLLVRSSDSPQRLRRRWRGRMT